MISLRLMRKLMPLDFLLVIVQYDQQHHHVILTNGDETMTEKLTRREADLLVSAWTSPGNRGA